MAVFTPILNATGVVSLGTASSGPKAVGRIVAHVVGTTWTGSAVPQARVGLAGIANAKLQNIPYLNVGTGAILPAGTAITADGVYEFPANGVEVVLNYTHTAGSANVYVTPMEGGGQPIIGATATPAGSNTIGTVGLTAAASKFKSASVTAAAAVKAAPGTLYEAVILNGSAATAFIQVFDALVGGVTLGTTVPDFQVVVAAGASVSLLLPSQGVAMGTGITIASTTTQGGAVLSAAAVYAAVVFA